MIKREAAVVVLALSIFLTPELKGQDTDGETAGRAHEIQTQRSTKSGSLDPAEATAVEKTFDRISRIFQRMRIRVGMGGLGPGAGLTIGSDLQWSSDNDRVQARLWGTGSVHRFYNLGSSIETKSILDRDISLTFEGSHADAPQLEYYGPGPNSSIHDRTNFRREDTFLNVRVGFHARRRFQQTCGVGQRFLNVGPGTNDSLATTDSVFGPGEAPGIQVQSNFLIAGCSFRLDVRDFPEDPSRGLYAEARYYRYYAEGHPAFSFHRLSGSAQQTFAFFNQKRVIEIRAKTELSLHSEMQVVPFYLQPTIGSDADLRGFRRYRFYDENAIALTGEYRWQINTGFDMALFVDGGKVFHRPGQISLSNLEGSAGFGLRFKNRRSVVARIDTGFSREGFQVWFKFGKLF
jgi:hypothetical protein